MDMVLDTPAIREIQSSGIQFKLVQTEVPKDPQESAEFQGIELSRLLRTIVVRRGENDYVLVLVPGGRRIDWPKLRSHLGVNRLSLPDEEEALGVTGYAKYSITPFGAQNKWPVVADSTIAGVGIVAIGAGKRGANFHIDADQLIDYLDARVADISSPA